MPQARTCARPDCGRQFRDRRADAIYCKRGCARVMAQRRLRERRVTVQVTVASGVYSSPEYQRHLQRVVQETVLRYGEQNPGNGKPEDGGDE
jgi:hypothetical protein